MSVRVRLLLHALALCLGLLTSTLAQAVRVDISAVTTSMNLQGALTILRDPTGTLAPTTVANNPGLQMASPQSMQIGFTSDIIWLQIKVFNGSGQPQTRWLALASPRLETVDFFHLDAKGRRVEQSWPGGTARPLDARPIPGKESLFPVTLLPGEEATLLLQISGRSLITLDATLWEPIRYREHEAAADLSLLTSAAALLAVSVYLLFNALWRRDKPFILFGLWLCAATASELALRGYVHRFWLTDGGELVLRAPVIALSLSMSLAAAFIHTFLSARTTPALSRILSGVCIAGLALALCAPFFELRLLAAAYLSSVATLCLSFPFVLLSAWRKRHPNVGFFILALSGLWLTTVLRMLVILGALPSNAVSSVTLSLAYALGLSFVAMLGMVQRAEAQNEQALKQQGARLAAQQQEHARLEAAIDARTRALQDALIAADEANRAKGDFLARVSHDLRAPLTAILGYADLIIGNGGRPADSGRIIRRSAQHLLGLLNDLIDYARGNNRPDALQPLPVYAASLLKNIAAEGESLARRNHNRFDYQLSCDLPAVIEVDEKRLRHILINLLDNASKFTHHGHIRFSVQCGGDRSADEPLSIVFTVEDDGPGMAHDELAHIFEPFKRLKATESHEGLGLGLAIAKQWVDCMNGHIHAESTPGQGTRMRVTMSLKPASEDALSYLHQTCGEDNLPELDGGGRQIWVVEDSHEIRNLLCHELRSQGFTALPIANGHDALTLIANPTTHAPELVLTDLKMPFASGDEVLAGVHARWPALPVVLLTATPDAAERPPRRFSAILSKPVSLLLLRQTLADLLELEAVSSSPAVEHSTDAPYPDAMLPDANHLADALALIRMGAVSDLIDWADSLAAENPAWSDFATHARALAERGEMAQLLSLCTPSPG